MMSSLHNLYPKSCQENLHVPERLLRPMNPVREKLDSNGGLVTRAAPSWIFFHKTMAVARVMWICFHILRTCPCLCPSNTPTTLAATRALLTLALCRGYAFAWCSNYSIH